MDHSDTILATFACVLALLSLVFSLITADIVGRRLRDWKPPE